MSETVQGDVSVVIPTFNRASHLDAAIASAWGQTVRPREVIVVDDGSTDRTPEVCERWGSRIRFVQQENSGVSAARNQGARVASGRWLAFLDSDDRWLPTKLEVQLEAIETSRRARWSVTGGATISDARDAIADSLYGYRDIFPVLEHIERSTADWFGRHLAYRDVETGERTVPVHEGDAFPLFLHGNLGLPSSLVLESVVFDELAGFDESLRLAEETEFFLRLTARAPGVLVGAPLVAKGEGGAGALTGPGNTLALVETALACLEQAHRLRQPLDADLESARSQGMEHLVRRRAYALLAEVETRRARHAVLEAWSAGRLPSRTVAWMLPATLAPRPVLRAMRQLKRVIRRVAGLIWGQK